MDGNGWDESFSSFLNHDKGGMGHTQNFSLLFLDLNDNGWEHSIGTLLIHDTDAMGWKNIISAISFVL